MTHPMTRRRRATLLAVAALLLAFPVAVHAHAELDVATPKDGATITGIPPEISGTYTQDLADGSSLKLRDSNGALIAEGVIDPADDRRMFIREIPELAAGSYTVRSTTLSAEDDETDRASWTFTVEAAATPSPSPIATATPAPSDSQAPTPAPSDSPAPTPSVTAVASPSPSGDGGSAGSTGDALLPIIAAVVLLALGVAWFTRRGRVTPRP